MMRWRSVAVTAVAVAAVAVVVKALPLETPVDFDGDGLSDVAVVRNVGGGPTGQVRWYSTNVGGTSRFVDWGIASDFFVPADYDGDGITDHAIWRPGAAGVAAFYILQSSDGAVRVEVFGQTGDDPSIVSDYDGDGRADIAVYRAGAVAGQQSFWFYRGSLNNPSGAVTYVPWGLNGDFVAPGDYDGDGRADFAIQRNNGGGQAKFWILQSTDGVRQEIFGTPTDVIVPGDYDGDGRTDLAVVRGIGGQMNWFHRRSSDSVLVQTPWGASATDFPTQGDYDGDGRTDLAIWRPSASAGGSAFWVRRSSDSGVAVRTYGSQGDYPLANVNVH